MARKPTASTKQPSSAQVEGTAHTPAPEVQAVLDLLSAAEKNCRLLEKDGRLFRSFDPEERTLRIYNVQREADRRRTEAMGEIESARTILPLAAWALGSLPSRPVGVYEHLRQELGSCYDSFSTDAPQHPSIQRAGSWKQVADRLHLLVETLVTQPRQPAMSSAIARTELAFHAKAAALAIEREPGLLEGMEDYWDGLRASLLDHLAGR